MNRLWAELLGPDPSPLDGVLARRVVNSWVAVHALEIEQAVRPPSDPKAAAHLDRALSRAHRRLVEAKGAQLSRIDAALRPEAEENLKQGAAEAQGARLSNLIAYRGLVEAANTWPFDPGVWLRFAVYVALGLGSWLGGALVDRLIDRALG